MILGQTASGKTSLALSLSRRYSLPVISADAFQCFKRRQIGTDKPKREETEGLPYYFYDEYDPDEERSVFTFQKECRKIIERYRKEGKDILVVGGNFLYVKALLFNYVFPEEEQKVNPYESLSLLERQELLRKRSRKVYEEIDHENPRRVIRALLQLDEGIDRDKVRQENDRTPIYPCTFLRIDIDKEKGNALIDKRVDKRREEGFVDEVKRLLSLYPSSLRPFSSIGYKEIITALEQGKEIDSSVFDLIKLHTRQYAKKQRTALRHQFPSILSGPKEEIGNLISANIERKKKTRLVLSPEERNKIEKTKILFCGLGGVGGEGVLSLTRLGFVHIDIRDNCLVSADNLNRQSLFAYKDIGRKKIDVAKERRLAINPLREVNSFFRNIEKREDLPLSRYDIIVDAIDYVPGKVALYRKARKDHSFYLTSGAMGFRYDSTKVKRGEEKDAFDLLSKKFKKALSEEGIKEEEINQIKTVFASSGQLKGKKDSNSIGSLSTVGPSAGLALTSRIIQYIREETKHEN